SPPEQRGAVGRGLPRTLAVSARFEFGDAPLEVGEFRLRALEKLSLNLEILPHDRGRADRAMPRGAPASCAQRPAPANCAAPRQSSRPAPWTTVCRPCRGRYHHERTTFAQSAARRAPY